FFWTYEFSINGVSIGKGNRAVFVSEGTAEQVGDMSRIALRTSKPAVHVTEELLEYAAPCPPDWDVACSVTATDLFAVLNSFFTGDAEFNESGSTDAQAVFGFLSAFFDGC